MGVQGLWDLLAPVGRRVSVETLSGKRLAIDASIWLVQFMKAMRDDNGDMVRNAHLLGFFRRICKLLYLRTKPVFVFDGGTPALKRRTVIARRRQRENAQAKIRKTAEKLLLNQLKAARLKELAKDLENQRKNQKNDPKGKKVTSEQTAKEPSIVETGDAAIGCSNQEKLDEMLAASIAAEEDGGIKNASTSAGLVGEDDKYEDLILPDIDGDLDPDVLAALPPPMQHKLLMKKISAMEDRKSRDLEKIAKNKNEKGKEILSETTGLENNNSEGFDEAMETFNQEKLDEMLAASILAEDDGSNNCATSAASVPFEEGDEDDYDEEMILPSVPGKFDPAVLAALPPSMQLDLLVQMRERLMAENRQRYQKVKKAPEKFSELQIQAYLKTVAFRREIDQVQKAAAGKGVGGVQTSRIASEASREFIFSSSFTGDKQLFTSGGVLDSGDKQQQEKEAPSWLQSDSVGGDVSAGISTTTAGHVQDKSGNVFDDDDVETYTDERGRIRVSRVRAMGMRMTRDLQRNLDLMKEIEQDAIGTAITQSKTKGKGTSSEQEVRCLDDTSVGSTLLKDKNGPTVADNVSSLQISFEIGDRSFESDDDMFSHLVAGQPVDLSYVDNDTARGQCPDSASDSDWEEGTITTKFDGSSPAPEMVYKSSLKASSVNDDSEVEWEEGPSDANNGIFCQVVSGKPVSRGQLEEDHDLQEAIRISLKDLGSDKGFAEEKELEAIDPHENRQEVNMVRKDIQERKMNSGPLDVNNLSGEGLTNEADEFLPSSKTGMHKLDGFHKSVFEYPGSRFEEHPQVTTKENVEVPCTDAEQHIDAFTQAGGLSTSISLCATYNSGISKPDAIVGIPSVGAGTVEKGASILVRDGEVGPETGSSLHAVEETIANSSGAFIQSPESRAPADVEDQVGEPKIPDAEYALRDTSNYGTPVAAKNDNTSAQASLDKEIHILGQEFMNLEGEQRKHERNAESVTCEMFAECQELLQMFGIPYIIAPMEAEAQCAYMELAGLVDGVVTDDSDVLLFGACSVYKNIFDDRKYVETYFMKDIEKELGLTREKLIRMALLLGSDYTEGVSGIGIVNAIEVVNAFPEDNGLQKFREWIESPDPTILGNLNGKPGYAMKKEVYKTGESNLGPSNKNTSPMDEKKKCADEIQEIKQTFMDKHRNVSKNWYIPSSFPSEAVISAYWSPQVDKSAEPFIWGKPDQHLLQRLCWERFGWNIQKSDELLLPVLKEYNKRETQLRLEAFYTFNERFAKIRSKRIKKAVKGIARKQSSTLLDDVPVEVPEGTKKKRKRLAESSNVTEGPYLSSDNNLSGKRTAKRSDKGRTTGEDISSEMGITGQELLSDDEQQILKPSNKGRRGRGNGGRKGNGAGRERGRGRGRGARRLGQPDNSCSDTDNSNDEHAEQSHNSERLKDLRRSNRLRQQVSYTDDMDLDDVMESLDLDSERKAGKADSNPRNAESSSAREHQNVEDIPLQNDSPGDHLETGGGFCIDDGEAGHFDAGENCNPSGGNASIDYLESGGGFCVDDDQGETSKVATALAEEGTEKSSSGGAMNDVEFAALSVPSTTDGWNESWVDARNTSRIVKHPNAQGVGRTESEDHFMMSSSAHPENNVKSSVGDDVGGLSAMPFLRRKRRKG